MSFPGHLIDEYWTDVITQLSKESRLSRADATRHAELFRSQLASVDADELVYHREAREVARSLQERLTEVSH